MKNLKIAIDIRMYGLKHAGIGRYIKNLIKQIKKTERNNIDFWLIVKSEDFSKIKKELGNKFFYIQSNIKHYSIKEQLILPLVLMKEKFDLIHFPHFNVPIFYFDKYIVTIHDLIKHESKGVDTTTKNPILYWFKYLNYHFVFWLAVKRAAKVIVPSKWVKKQLISKYPYLSGTKIVVIYEGVERKFTELKSKMRTKKILNKYNLKKPYLLYVGSVYPHKNLERLILGLRKLNQSLTKEKMINLIIVCARSIFLERLNKVIKNYKAQNFTKCLGFVNDEDLAMLYRQALSFITPSLMEGFGLPGLEAMAAGCPVLSSRRSCLPEIYGKSALFFNPLDIDDIANKINTISSSEIKRQQLIRMGKQRVKRFSWQKTKDQTLQVYKKSL